MIWNFHGDLVERTKYFTGIADVYTGTQPPKGYSVLITPENPALYTIGDKTNVIVQPCIRDVSEFKRLGYQYYFATDSAQAAQVHSCVIIPPLVEYIDYKKQPTTTMVSLVHLYEQRDPKNYKRTIDAGCKVYGYPDNPIEDIPTIKDAKFVLHLKEVGYLCNVTLKAMSLTTPVIFSPESYKYGYQDYFKDGYNCIVTDDIDKALAISDTEYNKLRMNLYKTIKHIQSSYSKVKEDVAKYIENVIESKNAFNPS
jgi:hypothetical protein